MRVAFSLALRNGRMMNVLCCAYSDISSSNIKVKFSIYDRRKSKSSHTVTALLSCSQINIVVAVRSSIKIGWRDGAKW